MQQENRVWVFRKSNCWDLPFRPYLLHVSWPEIWFSLFFRNAHVLRFDGAGKNITKRQMPHAYDYGNVNEKQFRSRHKRFGTFLSVQFSINCRRQVFEVTNALYAHSPIKLGASSVNIYIYTRVVIFSSSAQYYFNRVDLFNLKISKLVRR